MSGVGVSGLIANLPATVTPYPTQDPALELGGYRSVTDAAARDAIPANFRSIGMATTLQDTGVEYKLLGGIANANWTPTGGAGDAYIIRADLAALAALDSASLPNGCQAFVLSEREIYQLDTANALTTFSPLIVARGAGAGKWYRRSRAYVVSTSTLWCFPFGGPFGDTHSNVIGFTPGQRTASSANAADIILDLSATAPPATQSVYGGVTDSLGNLWVLIYTNNLFTTAKICKFNLADVLASGTPTPALTIVIAVPTDPNGGSINGGSILFDRSNNLWLMTGHGGTFGVSILQRYAQESLLSSGTPTPDVKLTLINMGAFGPSTGNTFNACFDQNGSMWVGIGFAGNPIVGGGGAIMMLAADQLQMTDAALVPSVYWTGSNFPNVGLGVVSQPQIGPSGLLWVSCATQNKVMAFDPRAPSSGNQAPVITLTCTSFNQPGALAFDGAGNLWVANENSPLIYRLPAASIAASGAVVPDVILNQPTFPYTSQINFPNNPNCCGSQPSGVAATT